MPADGAPEQHTHSVEIDGQIHVWDVRRLWALAADLPPLPYAVAEFSGFDEVMWFGPSRPPTVRAVLDHLDRVDHADLSRPILLSEAGVVMDGVHRLCRALREGRETVLAVRFSPTPPPDRVSSTKLA
jgi:hypothetical protein